MNTSIINKIIGYFKSKPVDKVWLFGSFSRNEERADSDVDLMVRITPGVKMGLSFFSMMVDLEDILKRPVDLVKEGCLLPFAEKSVNNDKILIYERAS